MENKDLIHHQGPRRSCDPPDPYAEVFNLKPEQPVQSLRYNTGKPKLSYFRRSFFRALEVIARIKEFGAAKYDDGNWRKGNKPNEEYLDSFDRHMNQWLQGETYDQDSGCHHLGHAIWNLCALLELNTEGPVIDEKLFRERLAFWLEEKKKKQDGKENQT